MNLLEQYIEEVHSVEPFYEDWMKEFEPLEYVMVDLTINCYGRIERKQRPFEVKEWGKAKEQGYYMA